MAKRKTPAAVIKALRAQQDHMKWITDILRTKREVPLENQAAHVRDNSEAHWIGRALGVNMMTESILAIHNCYAGFRYQAEKPQKLSDGTEFIPCVGPKDEGYAEWRVIFLTRE